MSACIVMLSGGIDSAVALTWASQEYQELYAISFSYFLRPFRERMAVFRLLQDFPARLIEVSLPFLKELGDANTELQPKAPEGYVANRNLIFYSIAAHYAEINRCDALIGGHTWEDQEAFPDASPAFFSRLQALLNDALLTRKIEIRLPLMEMTKLQVLQKALQWNVPLQHTWSCYWDAMVPCGRCISCQERADAFRGLGIHDPLK